MGTPRDDAESGGAPRLRESLAERACHAFCEVALVAMVAITSAEVLLRGAAGVSLNVTDEFGGYFLAAFTFLSLPAAFVNSTFHRVEYFQAMLGIRLRTASSFVFVILSLVFTLLLEWQLIRLVMRSYESGVSAPTPVGTPLWIPQSAMAIGTAVLILVLIRSAWCSLRLSMRRTNA